MAGTHITIEIDDAELRREIADMLRRIRDPGDALAEIGEVLQASTQRRFGTQTAPDGERWAANTEATKARKRNPHVLTEDGILGDTIRWQLADGGRAVEVGSDREYAAVQQFGQTKGASGTNRRGGPIPWGDIPPRPFVGVSDADRERILEILARYLAD
jgi:phage virion morphogenesis protein